MNQLKSIFSENEIEYIVQAFQAFESIVELNSGNSDISRNLTGGLNIQIFHRLFMLSDEMIKNLFQLRPEVIKLLPEEIKNKIILLLV